ncbi:MAG TPA: hypothetical protein VFI97_01065 [Arthrobacter sp.]|nr:hypothetical protein [Arthrobacter sp.]
MTLTLFILLFAFGPALLGLVAAFVAWLIARRRSPAPVVGRAVRGWTLAGVLIALLAEVVWRIPRGPLSEAAREGMYAAPLVIGLIAVLILMFPMARRSATGTAALSRRTISSFASRWWFVALIAVVVAVLAVTVPAGMASSPDPQGLYRHYSVDLGTNSSIGTSIYGWYYSLPATVLHGLLLLAALLAISSVARPPLTVEYTADVATRRWRTRNILAVTIGALLLHLAVVLRSLSGTASMSGGISTGQGWFSSGTPFAALEIPLRVTGIAADATGWFLWLIILLMAAFPPANERSTSSWRSASR